MTESIGKILPFALRALKPISNEEDARRRAAWQSIMDKKRRDELADSANRRGVPASKTIRDIVCSDQPLRTAMFEKVVYRGFNSPGTPDLVFVCSGTGTGKTTGVSWLIARHPLSALYVTASQVCESRNAGNYQLLDAARAVSLLGVDELGLEQRPAALVELVIHRFDHGLITVLLGNLTREQLGERYADPRLRSRAVSVGRDVIIELGDEDLRVQR